MLAKCTSTKPLYQYQRQLSYEKHLLKLKQINSKGSITGLVNRSQQTKIKPWMKEKLKIEIEKSNKMIEEENQKLLSKLLRISTRNSVPVNDKIMHRDNVYRKNWLKSIKRDNEQFGDKLLNLRSSLQYSRAEKSMEDYEKVKQSMKANRRPKLPMLTNKTTGGNYLRKAIRTESEEVINHLNSLTSERDRARQSERQKQKVKTQNNIKKQKVEIEEQLNQETNQRDEEKTGQIEKVDEAENSQRLSNKIQKKSQQGERLKQTDI